MTSDHLVVVRTQTDCTVFAYTTPEDADEAFRMIRTYPNDDIRGIARMVRRPGESDADLIELCDNRYQLPTAVVRPK